MKRSWILILSIIALCMGLGVAWADKKAKDKEEKGAAGSSVGRGSSEPEKKEEPSRKDIAALVQALDSPNTKIATDASVTLLKKARKLGPGPVRLACAAAAKLHVEDAAPYLAWIVRAHPGRHEDDEISNSSPDGEDINGPPAFDATTRAICALALGKLTTLSSLPPGGGGPGRGGKGEKGHKPEVEADAPDEGVEALIHALRPHVPLIVRAASARALGFTFDEKALKPLKDIRDNTKEDPILRFLASWSYCRIGTFHEDVAGEDKNELKELQKKGWDHSCGPQDIADKAGEAFMARFGDLAGLAGVLTP